MFYRIKNKYRQLVSEWQLHRAKDKIHFAPEEALILTGDPRGGTTWLSSLLVQATKAAMIWEPLWLAKNPSFKNIGFSYRQYISEQENWPEAEGLFRDLFSGKDLNSNLISFTSVAEITSSSHLLFKFCRANQLLPWLTATFEFTNPPIYLLRHPCAVVASQLKQGGWDRLPSTIQFKDQPDFEQEVGDPDYLNTINTVEKRLALIWCMANRRTLESPHNNHRWLSICYEDLLMNPHQQLSRIRDRWKVPLAKDVLDDVAKPSFTTVEDTSAIKGADQIGKWKETLSSKQIAEIMGVVQHFGIKVYSEDPVPAISYD
ncbi:sulfotransferase [Roseivirga sp. BDSF3-8]|uniref:sulfotransferase n=1 Tax=Roseivirga sp. BDSF3-8 TaxID=3241598 RepID=UPI003531DF7E